MNERLHSLILKLQLLATCPFCSDNPCHEDCLMHHREDEDLTHQEQDDRTDLELARGELEDAEQLKLTQG